MILKVNVKDTPYDIVIERGSLDRVYEYIHLEQKVLILTDSGIPNIYIENLEITYQIIFYMLLNKEKLVKIFTIMKRF